MRANGYTPIKVKTALRPRRSGRLDASEEQLLVSTGFFLYARSAIDHVGTLAWGAASFSASTESPTFHTIGKGLQESSFLVQ